MILSCAAIGRSCASRLPQMLLSIGLPALFASDPPQVTVNILKLNLLIFFSSGSPQNASQTCPMDVDAESVAQVQGVLSEREHHSLIPQFSPAHSSKITSHRVCDCDELPACRCPSTSSSVRQPEFMTPMTSLNVIRDVFLGHHATRSCIYVFHADLQTIHRALDLHAIPYLNREVAHQPLEPISGLFGVCN